MGEAEPLDLVAQHGLEFTPGGFFGKIRRRVEQFDNDLAAAGEAFAADRKNGVGKLVSEVPFNAAAQRRQGFALPELIAFIGEIATLIMFGLAIQACRRLRRCG